MTITQLDDYRTANPYRATLEPALMGQFLERCDAFLRERPWQRLGFLGEPIDIQRGQRTVSCAVHYHGGLTVEFYADPHRHHGEFLNLAPTLLLIFSSYELDGRVEHSWPDQVRALPTLLRLDQGTCYHPRPADLEEMGTVLEWVAEFTAAQRESLTVQDHCGDPVTICWGYLNEIDDEEVRLDELRDRLDSIWWSDEHEEGVRQCALALLESPHLQWRQRLASHLYRLELFEQLEELYRKFRADGSEEWLYIGALCAYRRGQRRTFRRRVDKAAGIDDYGLFLFCDEYSDDYLSRWRELWMEWPDAVGYLRQRVFN